MNKSKEVMPCGVPSEDELELINQYTRRSYTADEVYTFSVTLCDNEVDRDYERFTDDALEGLANLYIGKTGIFDHNPKTDNQQARIYACNTERVKDKQNSIGEQYVRLTAKAYIPKNEYNDELISAIDSGIKKEVSVGCSMGKRSCSICGADLGNERCSHKKGKYYNSMLCHVVLSEPKDAYEWSFVAVPAQREAGVTKAYTIGGNKSMEEIIKSFGYGDPVCLTSEEAAALGDYIENLRKEASMGKQYRADLQKEVMRLCNMSEPSMSDIMRSVCEKMSVDELKKFKDFYSEKAAKGITPVPQLYREKGANKKYENTSYSI